MPKAKEFQDLKFEYEKINCPLCNSATYSILGIRGNREYFGADATVEPHIFTNVARCNNCDFIYTNPMIRGVEDLEINHYDSPDSYQINNVENIELMFNKRLDFISEYQSGEATLLDIGAGKGEFMKEAQKRSWKVTGVEPSNKFCAYAEKTYGLTIHNGYLGINVHLDNKTYSIITLNHVLEHIDNPQSFLEMIKKYSSDKGIIYIEVPNSDSWVLRIADMVFRLKGKKWSSRLSPLHPPYHKYGYSKKSLRFITEKAGYEIITLGTFAGKDRGYTIRKKSIFILLRNFVAFITNQIGNRELLYCICKIKK